MLDPSDGLTVFTDGSWSWKSREGGWAWVAIDQHNTEVEGSGFMAHTTGNRMEMVAVCIALEDLHDMCGPSDIYIFSDSEYVVLGAQDPSRSRNKNLDLWNRIDDAIKMHNEVRFEHVRGHQDSYYNNLADRLAGKARRSGQSNG